MVLVDLPFVRAAGAGAGPKAGTSGRVYDPSTMGVLRPRPSPFPPGEGVEGCVLAMRARL
jgi:hypothetical protein